MIDEYDGDLMELLDGLRRLGVVEFSGYGLTVRFGAEPAGPVLPVFVPSDTAPSMSGRMTANAAVELERNLRAGVHGDPRLWSGKSPPEFPGSDLLAGLTPKD